MAYFCDVFDDYFDRYKTKSPTSRIFFHITVFKVFYMLMGTSDRKLDFFT
jgi:hypothetical protein